MDGLLTADNLPVIISIVLGTTFLTWLRDIIDLIRAWRRGASEKERNLLKDALSQLEDCRGDLEETEDERDAYRRQVGRRDFLLLKAGIEPPNDGTGHGVDDSSS